MTSALLEEIQNRVEALILADLPGSGFELDEVRVRRGGGRVRVEILMDRESGGIRVDECADWNRRIGDKIEAAGIIEESYLLDVSSPGLGSPIRRPGQWRRLIGKNIKIRLKGGSGDWVRGRLSGCDEKFLILTERDGSGDRSIGLENIDSAVADPGF